MLSCPQTYIYGTSSPYLHRTIDWSDISPHASVVYFFVPDRATKGNALVPCRPAEQSGRRDRVQQAGGRAVRDVLPHRPCQEACYWLSWRRMWSRGDEEELIEWIRENRNSGLYGWEWGRVRISMLENSFGRPVCALDIACITDAKLGIILNCWTRQDFIDVLNFYLFAGMWPEN